MKSIALRDLSLLPKSTEIFPNLERLRIVSIVSPTDQDLLPALSQLKLQHLSLGMTILQNVTLFHTFRSFPKLQSLSLKLNTFSFEDCELLVDLVPDLKSVYISVPADFYETYAKFLSSLHQLENISFLRHRVLSQITRPLHKVRSLSLTYPSWKDMSVVNKICPDLCELRVLLDPEMEVRISSAVVGRSLQKLMLFSGIIDSLPVGVTFPNVTRLSFIPSKSRSLTTEDFFFRLCELFPNVEHLAVRHPDEISSSTLSFVCYELKSLTTLILRSLSTSESQELNVGDISQRRRSMINSGHVLK
jgi:hypothetical protein